MAKASKASKRTTAKAAKKSAAASGKENASSNKQNSRSNGGRGGAKKKSAGGSTKGKGKGEDDKKKSAGVTKAVQKKIDAWWEHNSDALIKTAAEESGWEEINADTVKAYKQFLQVKREMQDWENNKLLPCPAVLLMIESHESFDSYQDDMKLLCGHDFGGEESIAYECGKDKDYDYERELATFEAVQKRFGSEFDEALWNIISLRIVVADRDGGVKWGPLWSASDDCCVQLIQRSTTFKSAFEVLCSQVAGDTDPVELSNSFRFINYGTKGEIDPNDTPLGLRWTSYCDAVFALQEDETLIEVKKRGSDSDSDSPAFHLFCAANQTATMTTVLNDLVNDENDETDYVYMFKGKRLYGFETPMSLQMKDFDLIDAFPVQNIKYKRCICCNSVEDSCLPRNRKVSGRTDNVASKGV